jgi:hypothetical protein
MSRYSLSWHQLPGHRIHFHAPVATGGVTSPIELLMMNSTPKYAGLMPALITTGINTGGKIRVTP